MAMNPDEPTAGQFQHQARMLANRMRKRFKHFSRRFKRQNFQPDLDGLEGSDAMEITSRTIPEDYVHKRKTIHRCWQITV